ncbi:gag-pol polyprotein [Striga asiatica]|uniref:Gag-pol polyprotein n=1 Tax=Striga asiatica TaxID=4170 RepID=A0A5A7PIZ5_STRAF|nr:gag-pol polyprotein [Striga asiatica]
MPPKKNDTVEAAIEMLSRQIGEMNIGFGRQFDLMERRITDLDEGPRSVNEYTEEIYRLITRVELRETTDQIVSRYIGGLRVPLQDTMNLFSPVSVSDAHQRALLVEQQLARLAEVHLHGDVGHALVLRRSSLSPRSSSEESFRFCCLGRVVVAEDRTRDLGVRGQTSVYNEESLRRCAVIDVEDIHENSTVDSEGLQNEISEDIFSDTANTNKIHEGELDVVLKKQDLEVASNSSAGLEKSNKELQEYFETINTKEGEKSVELFIVAAWMLHVHFGHILHFQIKLLAHVAHYLNVEGGKAMGHTAIFMPFKEMLKEDFLEVLRRKHEATHANFEATTVAPRQKEDTRRRQMEFAVGDFVWAILTEDRFSADAYNEWDVRRVGPVEIIEQVHPDTYRLRLPSNLHTSDVFNVNHLVQFLGDNSEAESSSTGFEAESSSTGGG